MNAKTNTSKPKSSVKALHGSTISIYVSATRNNTIITIADSRGNTICQSSGGCTEKGARKRTAHAAKEAGKEAARKVLTKKIKVAFAQVYIRGVGSGRESAVLGFYEVMNNISVKKITDRTGKAHGGVRKRKEKRI